jgi:MFS family permease
MCPLERLQEQRVLAQRLRALRASPLAGRAFVLLASGRTISMLGSAMAPVALAFAVLRLTGSTGDLGVVLAARSVAVVVFLVLGGVISDRLPRPVVLVGSCVLAGLSQAAAAGLLLTGSAHLTALAALQAVNGATSAFSGPAANAVVPQTVPAQVLRQANALARMGSNAAAIVGAALGGVVVAVLGPGWGIAADAVSFFVAAVLFAGLRIAQVNPGAGTSMTRELADGWREFWARTWLWVVVVEFAFINMAYGGAFNVLGPVVAEQRLCGATAWGIIVAAQGAGLILGGVVSARRRASRPLLAGNRALLLQLPMLGLLAEAAPAPLVAVAAVLAGIGIEIFGVRWITTMHEQVPASMQSRLFAYDALGSFVFIPAGQALAGPAQSLLGTGDAIWAGTTVIAISVIAVLFVPQVRSLRAQQAPAPSLLGAES